MVNRQLKTRHEEFAKRELSDLQNIKKRWQFINKVRGTLKSCEDIPVLRNSFGNLIFNKKEIFALLNVVFSGLGNYCGNFVPYCSRRMIQPTFNLSYWTEQQCYRAIKRLDTNKPLDPSHIPAWAIKDGQEVLVKTYLQYN